MERPFTSGILKSWSLPGSELAGSRVGAQRLCLRQDPRKTILAHLALDDEVFSNCGYNIGHYSVKFEVVPSFFRRFGGQRLPWCATAVNQMSEGVACTKE